jgi:hypothetical protein
MLVKTGIAKGEPPFAGARGVLAPSTSPSRRRPHKGALESPEYNRFPFRFSVAVIA